MPKKTKSVFIVGCGHSGTSIMLSLLDNHSKTYTIKSESNLLFNKKIKIYKKIIQWYKEAYRQKKIVIVEKTPSHIHKIDAILSLPIDSKVILMLRDGRDVACSIKERTGNFKEGIERWKNDNEKGLKYWSNDRVWVQKLEDLVSEPVNQLSNICEFIGIEYETEMISKQGKKEKFLYTKKRILKSDFEDKEKSQLTHSLRRNWQVNQELFKNTCRWKDELSTNELKFFNDQVGYLLKKFNYI